MNDRYLFRAKRIDNGEWVEGYLVETRHNTYHDGYRIIDKDGINYDELDYYEPSFISYVIDKTTICQCTGLKDKNGKLIWENDVIATDCGNARVMYSNDPSPYENSFYVDFEVIFENITDNENYRHDLGYWIKFRGFEVIGNIFDNPELLESEE